MGSMKRNLVVATVFLLVAAFAAGCSSSGGVGDGGDAALDDFCHRAQAFRDAATVPPGFSSEAVDLPSERTAADEAILADEAAIAQQMDELAGSNLSPDNRARFQLECQVDFLTGQMLTAGS